MYVEKQYKFEASHILPRHPGKCSILHGHSWRVWIKLWGEVQKESQFVRDFNLIDLAVEHIIKRFDHSHLNWWVQYPSSENIATHIAWLLRHDLLEKHSRMVIEVSETEKTRAVWDSFQDMHRFRENNSEWSAPELHDIANIRRELEALKTDTAYFWQEWSERSTKLKQLELYVASINPKPELPDFAAAKKSEEELANARKSNEG